VNFTDDLARIARALDAAERVLRDFTPGAVVAAKKAGGDPLTEADLVVNRVLHETLPQAGEGWLSEETVDDAERLTKSRVWIVDPIDGTKEFVEGLPEWGVSIGLVIDGVPVAGGVLNPQAGERVIGARGHGVTLNGARATTKSVGALAGAEILASRSEMKRGEWDRFSDMGFVVKPMGSVAYKLARVAAGLSDATWTLVPKNEWDVAAGVALVVEAGGRAVLPDGRTRVFNQKDTLLPGLVTVPSSWMTTLQELGVLPRGEVAS